MSEELIAENSKLREVLTKISELDYKNAATNGAAFEAVKATESKVITKAILTRIRLKMRRKLLLILRAA